MSESHDELIVPASGEIVNLNDVAEVARAYRSVIEIENALRSAKDTLRDALVAQKLIRGTGTFHVDGLGKVEVKGGNDLVWDAWALKRDLLEAGMPRERVAEIVVETIDARVSAVEAKKAASANPAYAEIVERHRTTSPKRPSVSVP